MTDSRVTPQAAVEAGAEQLRATHWNGMGCGTHGTSACSRCYGPSPADAAEVAEEVLAAAVPLLCQPLQDEIDRLRAENVNLRQPVTVRAEKLSAHIEHQMWACCVGCEAARAVRAVLAAVPVGTGGAE